MTDDLFGENTFKANILENLTTGMYHDSKVIYREYIQNACDSIDKAVENGLFQNTKEGVIEIWIDVDKRSITIEDNGLGLSESDFKEMLTTIGGSQKQFGINKGFRGMGRLCGLGYCTTLIFTSSAKGEAVESVLTCDAVKMRNMINEHNAHTKDYSALEVLRTTTNITTRPTDDVDGSFFRVELIGISSSNKDLLDKKQVKDYLAFVAPVPYRNTFNQRRKIYNYAKNLNLTIDEYSIKFEGESIYKDYKPTITTSKGEDTITDIDFHSFKNTDGKLIAWLWYGLTRFQAMLKKDCIERGIRLRKENIQIGDEDALQKLFKEDRGQHYFVGEVFAVDGELIPNSQRDYFNENEARSDFESKLKLYFNETLSKIYKEGSTVNAAAADINKANKLAEQIAETQVKGEQVDPKLQEDYEKAWQKAEKKHKKLSKIKEQISKKIASDNFQPADIVVNDIIEKSVKQPLVTPVTIASAVKFKPPTSQKTDANPVQKQSEPKRMISLARVKEVIIRNATADIATLLIAKIEEEAE